MVDMEMPKYCAAKGMSAHVEGCPVRRLLLQVTRSGISSSHSICSIIKNSIHVSYK